MLKINSIVKHKSKSRKNLWISLKQKASKEEFHCIVRERAFKCSLFTEWKAAKVSSSSSMTTAHNLSACVRFACFSLNFLLLFFSLACFSFQYFLIYSEKFIALSRGKWRRRRCRWLKRRLFSRFVVFF